MGFRFYKRINLGNGAGLNVSRSGVSSSIRTRFGSFGARGYSIRTGIPGLSYRKYFGNSKKGRNDAAVLLMIILLTFAIYIAAIVLWNVLLFTLWILARFWNLLSEEYALHEAGEKSNFTIIISLLLILIIVAGLLALYHYRQ